MAVTDEQLTEEEQLKAARSMRERGEGGSEPGTIGDQIAQGGQQRAARELRQERGQEQRGGSPVEPESAGAQTPTGRLRQAREALRNIRRPRQAMAAIEDLAQAAAEQAQRRLWTVAHEVLEDVTLSFWPLAFLIGFGAVGLLVIRIVLAYPLRAFFSISFRGVELPLAPPFSSLDFALRFKGILAYAAWGLEWIILIFLYSVITFCAENRLQCLTSLGS